MANGGDFLVRIRTQFESTGIEQITAQARQALAQLATTPNLTQQQRVQGATAIRTGAEARLAQIREQGVARAGSPQEAAAIRAQYTSAHRSLTALFAQMESGSKITANQMKTSLAGLDDAFVQGVKQSVAEFNKLPTAVRKEVGEAIARANAAMDIPTLRQNLRRDARDEIVSGGTLLDPRGRPMPASQQSQRAADERYVEEQLDAARFKAQQNLQIQKVLASEENYIAANAMAANARRTQSIRQNAAAVGVTGVTTRSDMDLMAETAVRQRIQSELQAAATTRMQAERQTIMGRELAAAEAQNRAATRMLAHVRHEEARREVQAAIRSGQGTRFQQLQAQFAYRGQQRMPDEYQRLGQFVGSRALVTGGFAVAGAAMYGTVRMVGEMVREAEELEKVLNQVEAQLRAIGPAAESSFGIAKDGILEIARTTGAQADEVGSVFFQFRGAFAGVGDNFGDTEEALRQTEQAMKTVAVTGLSMKEVLDSLTAVAKTFSTDVDDITDAALGLQERFGVLARETITFVADLAPIAKQIGMSLEDTAALGAVAQQVSGRAGSALAEGFGRILPAIADVKSEILSIYNLPQLQGQRTEILDAFALGDTGAVFQRLIRDYDSLTRSQQQFVITTLGGRREAQVLIPVLENASKLTREWDNNLNGLNDDAGKTEDYFRKLQDTISNTKDRFGEIGKQIGEALFASGLADFFADVIDVSGHAVSAIAALANVFGDLNNNLGGIPARLLIFAGLMRALQGPLEKVGFTTKANTAANLAQAQSQAAVTTTSMAAAAATQNAAAADIAETVTSQADAAANRQQALSQMEVTGAYAGSRGRPIIGGYGRVPGGTIGQTLFGGGSIIGAGMPKAGGIAGAIAGAAPVFAAFEALNRFFQNTAEQAREAASEADAARQAIEAAEAEQSPSGETVDQTIERLRQDAAKARNEAGKVFESGGLVAGVMRPFGLGGQGTNINRAVNFIGGTAMNAFGMNGDAALRSAAGEDQESDQILEQIAAKHAEEWAKNVALLLSQQEEEFLGILQEANIDALNQTIAANPGYAGEIKDIFGPTVEAAELTRENIARVAELAIQGNQMAASFLEKFSNFIDENPELQALVEEAMGQVEIDEAGGQGGLSLQDIESARKLFENNQITVGTFLADLREERQKVLDFIDAAVRNRQPIDPADLAALAELDGEISDMTSTYYENQRDALAQFRGLVGVGGPQLQQQFGGDVQGALLDQQIGQLTMMGSRLGGMDLSDRVALVGPLIESITEKFQRELEAIEDPVARASRAAQGFEVPAILQQLFVAGQLQADPTLSGIVDEIATITEEGASTYFDSLATSVVETADSARDIVLQILDAEIARLQEMLGSSFGGQGPWGAVPDSPALQELIALRDRVAVTAISNPRELGGSGFLGDEEQKRMDEQAEQYNLRLAQARANLNVARAGGDPVAAAQARLDAAREAQSLAKNDLESTEAEIEVVQAEQELENANLQIAQARSALNVARAGGDPVVAAKAKLDAARAAQAAARNELEAIQAETQVVQAEQELQNAYLQIAQARNAVAVARANGDPVLTARLNLQAAYAAQAAAQGELQALQAEAQVVNALNALYDAQTRIAQARIQVNVARANGDPIRIAQLNLQAAQVARSRATNELQALEAEAQYVNALNELYNAQNDVAMARLELQQKQVGRDPVRNAYIGIQIANQAIASAQGEAARIRAEGGLLDAQRAMQDALVDIVRAQSELITASVTAAGDMIEVANEEYRLAVFNLQQVLGDPTSGEAERIRAQADVVRARASQRDAEYQDRLGTIEFLLDMERISIGQAIEMLQSLASIPELTEQQLRQIQQRIKALRDEAGQNFQFNLPSVIDLPTLYEARRFDQSTAAGTGYNDNRVISVSITAQTNASAEDIGAAVANAIGDPTRSGTRPKSY